MKSTTNNVTTEESIEGNKRENLNKNRSSIFPSNKTVFAFQLNYFKNNFGTNFEITKLLMPVKKFEFQGRAINRCVKIS